jgi:hypothetical protein
MQLAAAGIGLGPVSEEQFVKLAAAMVPVVSGTAAHKLKIVLDPVPGTYYRIASAGARVYDPLNPDVRPIAIERPLDSFCVSRGPSSAFRSYRLVRRRWRELLGHCARAPGVGIDC